MAPLSVPGAPLRLCARRRPPCPARLGPAPCRPLRPGRAPGMWAVCGNIPGSAHVRARRGAGRGSLRGAQKAPGRLGEAWPPRPGWGSGKRVARRPPRRQDYFRLRGTQCLKGVPGPGPDGGRGTLMGTRAGSPGPLLSRPWDPQAGRKRGAGSGQRASQGVAGGWTIPAKAARYPGGRSAWGPGSQRWHSH